MTKRCAERVRALSDPAARRAMGKPPGSLHRNTRWIATAKKSSPCIKKLSNGTVAGQ